ncbi:type IV pilus modification PilV family protein [Robinsoniella peoriensis]|uniref:type IV pilus modification PilV family protein n=1 Tax=Robinsoniella peoriensis TaxID=180332 RepID=UPI00362EB881
MKKNTPSKSSLFLIELIIAILFFTVASGICIQLFSKSFLLSQSSKNLSTSSRLVSNTAEVLESCNGSLSEVQSLFPESVTDGDSIIFYYDTAWEKCSESDSKFTLIATVTRDSRKKDVSISSFETDKPEKLLYSLAAQINIPHTLE